MKNLPISTQWTLDAADAKERNIINPALIIHCPKAKSKGSSFYLKNGYVITAEHVIRNCTSDEIIAIDSCSNQHKFSKTLTDSHRDLAALKPNLPLNGGLALTRSNHLKIRSKVITWGHPLLYNGPAPLSSVGYLAGFVERQNNKKNYKHLVVNGAFNPGNSGRALLDLNKDAVISVALNKHLPITQFH